MSDSEIDDAINPPPASPGESSTEQRTLALLVHLSGVVASVLVPLIVWLIHKDKTDRNFLNDQCKEALNFQITILIAYVICWVLAIIVVGTLLLPLVWLVNLVFCIVAGVKANEGVAYRYPFALRLVK